MRDARRLRGILAVLGVGALMASCAASDGRIASRPASEERGPSMDGRAEKSGTGFGGDGRAPERGPEGPALEAFDTGRAMNHVRALAADIGVRVRASTGEDRGIEYVADKLRGFGYRVNVQEFAVDGGKSHNVVAWWPNPHRQRLVIGGHIDTVRGSPGANDNASGVGAMLENARIFAGTPQARWVRFVAFGSEEYGTNGRHHLGSNVYLERLGGKGRRRTVGMVSVDMIADGRPLITGTAGIGPPRVARTLFRKLDRAGIAVDYRITCDCSDNGPFERAGISASFMWSGDEPNYHDDSDTVRNLKRKHLRRSGRSTRIFLKQVDRGMIAYFRDS